MGMRIVAALSLTLLIPACGGDTDGGAPTSAAADDGTLGGSEPPFIRIVSPGPNTVSQEGGTINLQAMAVDPDETVVRVDFFDGTEHIGTRWAAPFVVPWGSLTRGTHILTAVALDVDGLTWVSEPVVVIVRDDDNARDNEDDRHNRRLR
jgi:hypothetical protein